VATEIVHIHGDDPQIQQLADTGSRALDATDAAVDQERSGDPAVIRR
jgi:hypothetical protein